MPIKIKLTKDENGNIKDIVLNPTTMTVKSQDDLGKQGRDVEVLISTIKELERTKKQLEIAKDFIFRCANDISGDWYINNAKGTLKKIEELEK